MIQNLPVLAAVLAAASGLPALLCPRGSSFGEGASFATMLVAATLGLISAFGSLLGAAPVPIVLPFPALALASLAVDPLSAFFLIPIFLVGALGSLYALGYRPARRHPRTSKRLPPLWGLLVAGLGLLVMARNAFAFLVGWEFMALSAFLLILLDDESEQTRRAGLVYLIATHVGTLLLFALFALWRHETGSFEFLRQAAGSLGPSATSAIFLLALAAFALKAGIMPLHFWLPGAHAAAPSQVSAMLSGVVLKMGIYGILRFIFLLPDLPAFWGLLVLALGAASALLGVAFAIAQHDLKRLLAYHSVENIGIILMGIGLSLVGVSSGRPGWTLLGLAAALLHVWNHALFKSLLFLGAGSVIARAGTRHIDRLGGLAPSMPWTAALFLAGAVAISGLPPLNGFVSEFLVYLGALRGGIDSSRGIGASLLVVPVLAATGALALACFVKVYGAVFLGSARYESPRPLRESPLAMILPMALLASACFAIGFLPQLVGRLLDPLLAFWAAGKGFAAVSLGELAPLRALAAMSLAIALAIGVVALAVLALSRPRRGAARVPTWDCGYARPEARMQYTASSFRRFVASFFAWALRPKTSSPRVEGPFPSAANFESHVGDATLDGFLLPLSRRIEGRLAWFRRFQQGQTQWYLLYILFTILVLLGTLVPFGDWLSGILAG